MPRRSPQCDWCGRPAGPRCDRYCDYCAGYHAGHSARMMFEKRATNPIYRELERRAVKKRMRKLRADPNYVRPEKRSSA